MNRKLLGVAMVCVALFFTLSLTMCQKKAEEVAEYKVGAVFSVTGRASFLGDPEKKTAEMVVEQFNKAGGINGKPVKLIVYDDEGVYGDGVNVASRIEGLAVSGSIFISGKVFEEIKNHHAFRTVSMGSFELKNVKKPVEVFAIGNEGLTVPTRKEIQVKPKDKLKSLAVLPFVNMSPDPENEYFSDGITEELLNVMAKIEGLQVTARTSSLAFKGRHEDIKQIGAQLGAKTVLEGSVRKVGNRVRITAQLINTADGYHIWSETYDRQLNDIFEVQDEIALKISNKLREKLTLDPSKDTLIKIPTESPLDLHLFITLKVNFFPITFLTLLF